jgi:hypothetical protein
VRRYGIASLVTGALVLAGCGAPQPPEVTFFAAGTTTRLSPSPSCDAGLQECKATGTLAVPSGKLLNISVPGEVAETPWLVVFRYRGADGNEQKARSAIFPAGDKYAYTLTPPTAADQLTHVEVQRITGMSASQDQGVEFYPDAIWALDITG